jgi:hypothetical protein
MNRYSNIDLQDMTRQLVVAGFLPVYAQDAAITHPAPDWLLISQVGGDSVFDLDGGGGTGCILDLHVAVDRPAFSIWRWELDLLWKDPKFQWVPEPQGGKYPDNMYRIPGCQALEYSRNRVINHRRKLGRGNCLDGLLLGFSFVSIPDFYHHGASIDARLVLVDEMENSYSKQIQLYVDRSAKFDRQRGKEKVRRRLFDQLVDNGEELLKDEEDVLIQT